MSEAELSVIIPTYNEHDNVRPIIAKLEAALTGIAWEAIFVDDDSPDGTAREVKEVSKDKPNIKVLHRIGRRGLSSACIEGMHLSTAAYMAVIDGDMQHDETRLPLMLERMKNGADIVVGTRYAGEGGTGDWGAARLGMSKFATCLGNFLLRKNRTSDPMSGFFMLSRELFDEVAGKLASDGFKILLDILASSKRKLKVQEVAYTFRTREFGESKLTLSVLGDFAMLLIDKSIGRFIPAKFVMFAVVGCIGLLLHLCILGILNLVFRVEFVYAQIVATLVAIICNFYFNNIFTFGDTALKGFKRVVGFVLFLLICGVGAIPNVMLAKYLYSGHIYWMGAGAAGLVVTAIWNYAVSSRFVWRK